MKKLLTILSITLIGLTLTACNPEEEIDENVVYVTVYPMQFLVEEIAGDTVRVERIPGTSSHGTSVDWSFSERIDIIEADLLFYVNGGADPYITSNEEIFSEGTVQLVDMSQHIEYNKICYTHTHDHEEEEHEDEEHTEDEHEEEVCDENSLSPDPHFWLNPVLMIQAAEFVKDKLIATFPENQEVFNNNYTVLNASLEYLEMQYAQMGLDATKPIMTTVRLFTYWEEQYGIEIIPLTNDIHSEEGTPGSIIELVDEALYHDILLILFEKNANSPTGEEVLRSLQSTYTEAAKLELHGLGNITMEEEENGLNYLSIMYENLKVLEAATK